MSAGAAYPDPGRIRAALAHIPADDRDTWVSMGMAVKSELGEDGFPIWDQWSQQAENYQATDSRNVWRSIRPNGGVTAGTLFHLAKANGWTDDRHQGPSTEELTERRRIAAERAAKEKAEIARERADTAAKAAAILKAATEAKADHPYLVRKHVSPVATLREIDAAAAAAILGYVPKSGGEPLTGPLLVAPVKQGKRLSTLELIDGSGRKAALSGRGTKAGGYWAAQPLSERGRLDTLLIGEGVATVLSAIAATGFPGVAALSSGNLLSVAQAMRDRYPTRPIIILADLVKATGAPDTHAIEAARAVGGCLAVPDFGPERAPGETDFNDLARRNGPDAVRRAIEADMFQVGKASSCPYPVPSKSEIRCTSYQMDSDLVLPESGSDEPSDGEQLNTLSKNEGTEGTEGTPYSRKASGCTPMEGVQGTGGTDHIPEPSERPCFRVFDDWVEHGGTKYRSGVWHFDTDKEGILVASWICSPLHVDAVTYDGQDNNFGRLLRFKNTLNRWREWAMPMELLSGLGNEIRAELLAMGVEIAPSTAARNKLAMFLQASPPKRQMRCALQVGWCGRSFVLPDVVIGPDAEKVIFQSGERGHEEYTRAGTLEGWREGVAARAVGNPILTFTISASFVGPLLGKTQTEGGGIHLVGDSSTGKTSAIEAGCSVWGGPSFRRSWRTTANGLEGAAALFNDCLLALDEISECEPREVGAIVYALGNGRGKQRASRTGAARGVARWRCFVLSSGERTIATHMNEGGHRAKAGQAVRLLDIPAVRRFGAWDDLQGLSSGAAFSDAIRQAAATHYGHTGRAFLERLTRDTRDFSSLLEITKALKAFQAEGSEGQAKRAAARFALIGLAGELATGYGITGWREGEAIQAAGEVFRLWRSTKGKGNDERRQILEQVSDFIEKHGDGRFSSHVDESAMIRDRAGWWRDTGEIREYLFTAAGMREALQGFDFARALDVLQEAGAVAVPESDGKRARSYRIGGRVVHLYPIDLGKAGCADVC